jgi:hypothetical protein
MRLTRAEQVSGGGACAAEFRLERWGNVAAARGGLAAGQSSVEAVVVSRCGLFKVSPRRRRGSSVSKALALVPHGYQPGARGLVEGRGSSEAGHADGLLDG